MTTLDAKALESAQTAFVVALGSKGKHYTPSEAVAYAITAYLESLPPQPVEVTEEMVEAAEAAVYPRHERGFLTKPLIDAIDMRKALEAALVVAASSPVEGEAPSLTSSAQLARNGASVKGGEASASSPDPVSMAAYYASIWGLSGPRMNELEAAFRSFTRPSGDGIRAGRAEVIEEAAKVADAMRQERAQMATDEDDQAEMDVLNGQAFIARCIAKNIRALIVPQEAVKE